MSSSRPFRWFAATVLAATVVMATQALPAMAAARTPADAQTKITAYLAGHPGGTQINAREISYGALIVTVTNDIGATAVADCPSGWFCFYEGINYTYPRGKLAGCG